MESNGKAVYFQRIKLQLKDGKLKKNRQARKLVLISVKINTSIHSRKNLQLVLTAQKSMNLAAFNYINKNIEGELSL